MNGMNELFSSPSMIATTVFVIGMQVLSVALLLLIIHVFRAQSEKYHRLFSSLGSESAWGKPAKILLPLYVVLTLVAAVVMLFLFIIQPHLI